MFLTFWLGHLILHNVSLLFFVLPFSRTHKFMHVFKHHIFMYGLTSVLRLRIDHFSIFGNHLQILLCILMCSHVVRVSLELRLWNIHVAKGKLFTTWFCFVQLMVYDQTKLCPIHGEGGSLYITNPALSSIKLGCN